MFQSKVTFSIRLLLVLLICALFVVISVMPDGATVLAHKDLLGTDVLSWIMNNRKLLSQSVHLCVFATLTLLCAWALTPLTSVKTRFVLALVVVSVFGVLVEILQVFVPQRTCALDDMLLNTFAALIGSLVGYVLSWMNRTV